MLLKFIYIRKEQREAIKESQMLNVNDHMKGNQGNQEGNLTCMPIRQGIE